MDFEKEFEVLLELCNPALIALGGLDQLETQLTKMMTEIERLQSIEAEYNAHFNAGSTGL